MLEQRVVPTITTSFASGTLAIVSTNATNDSILVKAGSSYTDVTVNGAFVTRVAAATSNSISTINFTGAGGSDTLDIRGVNQAITVGLTGVEKLNLTSTKSATVTSDADVALGVSSVSGDLTLSTTAGAITQSGKLSVTGIADFTANAGSSPITLTNAGNSFGSLKLKGTVVQVTEAGATDLGASTVSGALTVTSTGSITDSGKLDVTGIATLTATRNAMTLDDPTSTFGNTLVLSGTNVAVTDNGDVDLGTTRATNALTVNAAGNVTQSGSTGITVGGLMTINATGFNITLAENGGGRNNFGTIALNGADVSLKERSSTVLAKSTTTGNFSLISGGSVTDSGTLTIGTTGSPKTTTISGTATGLIAITLDDPNSAFSGALILDGTNVAVTNSAATILGTTHAAGTLTLTSAGAVSELAAGTVITVGGRATIAAIDPATSVRQNVVLNGTSADSYGSIGVDGAVVSINESGDTDLYTTSTTGTLTVVSTGNLTDRGNVFVDGTTTLTVGSGKSITLNSTGSEYTGAISVTGSTAMNVAITNVLGTVLGNIDITGTLGITSLGLTTNNLGIEQTGTLKVDGRATFTATNLDITLSGANEFGSISFDGKNVTLNEADATTGTNLYISTAKGTFSLTSTGDITDSGTLTIIGNTTLSNAGKNLTLDSGASTFAGSVSITASKDVVLKDNDPSGLTLGTSALSGTLSVTAKGDITDSGAITGTAGFNAATFIATNNGDINLDTTTLAAGAGGTLTMSAENATLTMSTPVTLGPTALTGALSLTTTGTSPVTDSAKLVVAGTVTIDTSAGGRDNITLDSAASSFGSLLLTGAAVTIKEAGSTDLGTSDVTTLDITSTGSITDSAATSVTAATATFNAGTTGDITLTKTTLTAALKTLRLTGKDVYVEMLTTAVDLGTSKIFGDFYLKTGGPITQSGTVMVAGMSNLIADPPAVVYDITLDLAGNSFGGTVLLTGKNVYLRNNSAVSLGNVYADGTLTIIAAGNISNVLAGPTYGKLIVTGATTLNAGTNTITLDILDSQSNLAVYPSFLTTPTLVLTVPTASITLVSSLTADDIINIAESSSTISITGTVGGDVVNGDIVSLLINGVTYTGAVLSGAFSINVSGSDLAADADSTINASVITTIYGAFNATASDTETYLVDTVRPTATLVVADTALKAGETSLVTITFNEPVTGFNNADLTTIENGMLTAVSSSDGGITWTATLTPTDDFTDPTNVITLTKSGVLDLAGNAGSGTTNSNNYAIDTHLPTATIVVADTALKAGETSLVTITFNEAVTGFDNNDLTTIENATLTAVASSDGGITWTATLTPTDDFTDPTNVITLTKSGVLDLAGNAGSGTTNSNNYAIDTHLPTATSFTRKTPATSPTTADTLVFLATFSEDVSGVADADFAVTGTTATISVAQVTASTYDVTISGGDLASLYGTVGLNFNSPTITDLAGNTLPNTEPAIDQTYFVDNTTLTATIVGNDLVLQDVDSTGKDNVLSLSRSGANLVISDTNEQFASAIPGAVYSNNYKTISIPATALGGGGKIVFKTLGGSDSLSVDVSTDLGFDVDYQGGTGTSDSLTLVADTVTSVTYAFTNATDGSITIVDGGTRVITFTGLEPITDNLNAADRSFTFNGGGESISLVDATGSAMTIDSDLAEFVTFSNPTSSLTISAGTGNDTVTITSVDTAFNAALIINGGTGNDTIHFNGDITFAADKSLNVDLQNDDATPGTDTINIGTNANLILSGTGAATLKASRNIALASGSSVVTANGNLTVEANQQTTATLENFHGVHVNGGLIQATGTGVVSVLGRAGADVSGIMGVMVERGGDIIGGTSGTMTVTGRGGLQSASTRSSNGVWVTDSGSTISSGGANVSVTGTGGRDGISAAGLGVVTGAQITAGGSGTVTVVGQGGTGYIGNWGVSVGGSNSRITSSGGNVSVTGTAGGIGTGGGIEIGVRIETGQITAGGSGTVTVVGQGGASSGSQDYGIYFESSGTITSSGGNVTVTGTAGEATSTAIVLNSGIITTATNGGTVTVIADSMSVDSSSVISAQSGSSVTLRQKTNGVAINLGSTVDTTASTLELSDAELDRVTSAGTLHIGDSASGAITISAAITRPSGGGVFSLQSGGAVTSSAGASINVIGNDLAVRAGGAITLNEGNTVGSFAATTTSGGITYLENGGAVSIGTVDGLATVSTSDAPISISTVNGTISVNGSSTVNAGTSTVLLNAGTTTTPSSITGTVTGSGGITVVANDLTISTATGSINAGSNTVTLRPTTAGRAINLGTATGALDLTDGELDRITTGTLNIGDTNSGTITFSAAITRSASTIVNVTTGSNKDITFSGTGSVDSAGGNVTLTTSGTGAITSGTATTDSIAGAGTISLTAGSGGIGASGNPIVVSGTNLNATTSGDVNQFLSVTGSITVDATGFSAGTGTVELDGGTFTLGGAGRINDSTKLNVNGSTFAIDGFNETVDTLTLTSGSVTGSGGVLTSTNTIQTKSGSASAILTGTNGLTQSTTGTTTLSGANSYTGTTTISAGTLQIGSGSTTGSLSASSGITNNGTLAFNRSNTVTQGTDFNSVISGNGSVAQVGSGTLVLNGTNTYTGTTTIAAGTLNANASAALGDDSATNTLIFTGGTLQAAGTITSLSTRTVTLTSTGLIDTNSQSVSIAGVMSGAGGLTKSGAGTLTLNGANTYTGTTTINVGTLLVNGSLTSNVTVASGGTLGGTGTINSANSITVQSGGTVAPGTSPGILNTGNVAFASGSFFNVEIGGTTAGNTSSNHDQLNVTGAVSLGGATLVTSAFGGYTLPLASGTYTFIIILNGNATGTFASNTISDFLGSGLIANISYTDGDGNNDVVITVVVPV